MAEPSALELASEVSALLTEHGEQPVLIGAIALAAHGYVRATQDVDLAIAVDPKSLAEMVRLLRDTLVDVEVTVEMPDSSDPLGGVIRVRRGGPEGFLVEVVNFDNAPGGGFPALVRRAKTMPFEFPDGAKGAVVSAEDLVFFKLYAGGGKSLLDIQELLVRRQVDRDRLEELARRYGMERELRQVLGPPTGC